jgi:hypothetical protein
VKLVESAFGTRSGHEAAVYRGTDHRVLEHGFNDASFYTWRAKYGGMNVSEAKRLRELEAESAKLKKLLAESLLDAEALKAAVGRGCVKTQVRFSKVGKTRRTRGFAFTTEREGRASWRVSGKRIRRPSRTSARALEPKDAPELINLRSDFIPLRNSKAGLQKFEQL